MRPRRFCWSDESGEHELALVWVPGTDGAPYQFGNGLGRRAIDLPGFYIATTPVTQALWQRVMGSNPAKRQDPRAPVENVSWNGITEPNGFLDRLNAGDVRATVANGDANLRFRLPTETEWEYAARGGPHWRDGYAFSGSNDPDRVGWYGRRWNRFHQLVFTLGGGWPLGWHLVHRIPRIKTKTFTHPVGSKAPNQLGIYDMTGNVWEWCQDVCTDDPGLVPADGRAYEGPGDERRLRGGDHTNWDLHCRVWWRYGIDPAAHDGCLGVRVVLAPQK
ncbi:MAG TPA: formylglycine-generating enzyme family protein [Vicinamibacterales bacterium]|nr:formylglycine-generating enzyme family protein [Vicinamibacterales bacterium]